MSKLWLDFETRSEISLDTRGLDNYASHESTEVLMLAWAFDEDEPELWSPRVDQMPRRLRDGLEDPTIIKAAWNAGFERTILHKKFGIWAPYETWLDPMTWARHMSLPGKLEAVGPILNLPVDQQKLERGAELIKLFCMPVVPAREGGLFGSTPAVYRDWSTDPKPWAEFEEYCRQDLRAERTILHKLEVFPLPPLESKIWYLDQKINDRGLPIDLDFVSGAAKVAELAKAEMVQQATNLTKLENVSSNDQILKWSQGQGYPFSSIGKAMVNRALAGEGELTDLGRQVLTIRQQLAKTASSKLLTIRDVVSPDGRLRDSFTYLGAARTGRWSSHGFQAQNFPRPSKEVDQKYDRALTLLRAGDYETIKREFSSPIDVVGSCLRSVVAAPAGYHFDVCDLGSIEPRISGWVAGCDALLKVFREGLDLYTDFAQDFYKKKYEAVTPTERQICKPPCLGCSYGLSGGELKTNKDNDVIRTGLWGYAQSFGVDMTRDEAHRAVRVYREKYPEVEQCWYDMDRAAIAAIEQRQAQTVGLITFETVGSKILRLVLPSGRALHYVRPRVEEQDYTDKNGRERTRKGVTYEGLDAVTKQWTRERTFGAHFFENVIQAIARDILAHGMLLADARGFEIVGTVHDEIIALTPDNSSLTLGDLRACMIEQPPWASDLLLDAQGYTDQHYRKG